MSKIIYTEVDKHISFQFVEYEVRLFKMLLEYAKHRLTKYHDSGLMKCVKLERVEDMLSEVNSMLE